MMAHAMKGDHRERSLAAGMGDVSKPIQPRELFEAIKDGISTADKEELRALAGKVDRAVIRAVLDQVAGEQSLLLEIAELFLQRFCDS